MTNFFDFNYKGAVYEFIPLLDNINDSSESNISMHIIEPILEDVLHFKKEWFAKEQRSDNSRKHFDIIIKDNNRNRIIIECKKANIKLNNEHLEQLTNYLNSQTIEWGILTNGYEWILVNNDFNNVKVITDKILFHVDIRSKNKMNTPSNMKYFTYESLFCNNGIINYVKQIIQFNIYKRYKKTSWYNYKCALLNLSEFLMEENNHLYVDMDRLQKHQLVKFYRWYVKQETHKTKNKPNDNRMLKPNAVTSLYRYINSFYSTLFERDSFKINPFNDIELKEILDELDDVIDWSTEKKFSIDETASIITDVYELLKETKAPQRNKVVFSLFIYGLSRNEIISLNEDDIYNDYIILRSNKFQRKLPISEKIRRQIDEYLKYKKKRKIKNKKLICMTNGKKINSQSLSELINEKIKLVNPNMNIQKIQQMIYKEYILKGKDILSVLYVTNLDVTTLNRFISMEEIKRLGKPEKILRIHPFKDIL